MKNIVKYSVKFENEDGAQPLTRSFELSSGEAIRHGASIALAGVHCVIKDWLVLIGIHLPAFGGRFEKR